MKLTSKSEYALLALIHLARCKEDFFVPVQVIAASQNIPPKFLEHILLILKRAKYVRSLRGQSGGYALAKPATEINLAEIIRLFEGALAPTESASVNFYESTPVEKEEGLMKIFREIRDYIADKLEHSSLADVI